MNSLRLLIDGAKTIEENMAIDEAIFDCKAADESAPSTLRFYTWSEKGFSIGYSQKFSDFKSDNLKVVRRLTGGLAVPHDNDHAYSFVTSQNHCPYVYDHDKMYQMVHEAFKNALNHIGIEAMVSPQESKVKHNLCRETILNYDLKVDKKKILGSCQRRRGKTLLQQGSLKYILMDRVKVAELTAQNIADKLNLHLAEDLLKLNEIEMKDRLSAEKYSSAEWNRKFP